MWVKDGGKVGHLSCSGTNESDYLILSHLFVIFVFFKYFHNYSHASSGRRANGDCGLFPEAYVEEFTEEVGPPSMAPPPLPQDYTAPSNTYATPSTPLNTNFLDQF